MRSASTINLRIYVAASDKVLLLESMRAYVDACNYISSYVYATKDLIQHSVRDHTYETLRKEYHLPSQMAISAVGTVMTSYRDIIEKGTAWINCRYNTLQISLTFDRDWSVIGDQLSIKTLYNRILVGYDAAELAPYLNKSRFSLGMANIRYSQSEFFCRISVACIRFPAVSGRNEVSSIFDFHKEYLIRTRLGLTRYIVAEILDIEQIKLYRLEKNLCLTNDLDMMNAMAELYGCFLDDLVKDQYHL